MKSNILLERIKRIKPTRLFMLIFLIMSNSFAWFIYATKIDSTVSVHVRSWNVVFEAGDSEVTDTVNLTVDSIYPGMENYSYSIKAYNRSEVSATLSYVILEANIFGDEYITVNGRSERGEAAVATDYTSEQLENILANNFPFSITLGLSNQIIELGDGVEEYTLNVVWPYENNNDEEDTNWGIRAYNYKESNPDSSSITLKVKIIITQNLS